MTTTLPKSERKRAVRALSAERDDLLRMISKARRRGQHALCANWTSRVERLDLRLAELTAAGAAS